jgi:hypothetical protein
MDRLVVFCTNWKSPGATPRYEIQLFRGRADGNPEKTSKVGDEGLKDYLESEYGLDPKRVDSTFRKLATSGEAETWIEPVPA